METQTETIAGITYSKPKVTLIQESGLGTSELAARTAYQSFDQSENHQIRDFHELNEQGYAFSINNIEHSSLLDSLAWVHFHHSVLELCNLTYSVTGTTRSVLQEHARHRIQSLTVQSTRYTMSGIINAFIACRTVLSMGSKREFNNMVLSLDILVVQNITAELEIAQLWGKLNHQYTLLGPLEFQKAAIAKSSMGILEGINTTNYKETFNLLQNGKQKRNVGDSFKWIVSPNWKVDLVFNMNLRDLKNYLELRNSGAAFFQVKWLAEEIIKATPQKYLDLIIKHK